MNPADETRRSLQSAAAAIRRRYRGPAPKVGIVLGSGLASAVPSLREETVIHYEDIPNFPEPTVQGHSGQLALGTHDGLPVAVLRGRFHYYEGHPMSVVTFPVRLLKSLGVETLVLTSAVGSINPKLRPGDFVFLTDHINLMGSNPLIGRHHPEFGPMFPDMSEAYDRDLRKEGLRITKDLGYRASEGVYIALSGPSYETPAEIRAFGRLGADIVGMSMVPEAIVARQGGMRLIGLSWIANYAAGLSDAPLRHPDVLRLGEVITGKMRRFLEVFLGSLAAQARTPSEPARAKA